MRESCIPEYKTSSSKRFDDCTSSIGLFNISFFVVLFISLFGSGNDEVVEDKTMKIVRIVNVNSLLTVLGDLLARIFNFYTFFYPVDGISLFLFDMSKFLGKIYSINIKLLTQS